MRNFYRCWHGIRLAEQLQNVSLAHCMSMEDRNRCWVLENLTSFRLVPLLSNSQHCHQNRLVSIRKRRCNIALGMGFHPVVRKHIHQTIPSHDERRYFLQCKSSFPPFCQTIRTLHQIINNYQSQWPIQLKSSYSLPLHLLLTAHGWRSRRAARYSRECWMHVSLTLEVANAVGTLE